MVVLTFSLFYLLGSLIIVDGKNESVGSVKQFGACQVGFSYVDIFNQLVHNSTYYTNISVSQLLATECEFQNYSLTMDDQVKGKYDKKVIKQHEIQRISISFSNITEFEDAYFCDLPDLLRLVLTNNRIDNVLNIGLGLNSECHQNSNCNYILQELDLSGNPLRGLQNSSLCLLENLDELTLNNCELTSIEEGSFQNNNKLNYLLLQGNFLNRIPCIEHLINLNTFDISNNLLTSLTSNDIQKLSNVNEINLSQNYIVLEIDDATFKISQYFRKVNMSYCNLQYIDYLFQKVDIDILDLSHNQLIFIEGKQFSRRIKNLILSHNQIESLIFTTADHPNYLDATSIDLSYNALTRLRYFILPKSLKQLDLSNNHLNEFYLHPYAIDEFVQENLNFPEINLKNNHLNILPTMLYPEKFLLDGNPLVCDCLNSWLFDIVRPMNTQIGKECVSVAKHNPANIKILSFHMFCESTYYNKNRCNVNEKMSFNPYKYISPIDHKVYSCDFECPNPCYCYTTAYFEIVHLYCSNSDLKLIPNLPDVSSLDQNSTLILWLDGNNFTNLLKHDFINFNNVVQLYINSSNIIKISNETFDNLIHLEILDLSKNLLTELSFGIFDELLVLKKLMLDDNFLKILPDRIFDPLKNLQILRLHNNKLSSFPEIILTDLSKLLELTINNNSWYCECKFTTALIEYLKYHTIVVRNLNETFCFENEAVLFTPQFVDFNNAHCLVVLSTVTKMWIGIGSAFAFLIISILMFLFRYEIQVLLYSKLNLRVSKRNETYEGKIFDAFIAYSSEDGDFLVDEILPKLEHIENPYSVCLHERNFMPGGFIQDAILEAVKVSSRTIVILTENFVRSGWCMYEFKVAHMQMMEDRCPRVIVIVKDEIPKDINSRLKMYIKTNTYLKWNERLFWEKLYFAMSTKRVNQISRAQEFEVLNPAS
ncbi:defense response [Chamberlinius hualienensis]